MVPLNKFGTDENNPRQIMKMSQFERIFILTAGSLSIIILILAVISWFIFRSFSTPSDILFAIVISELIQNTTLVIEAGNSFLKTGYFTHVDNSSFEPQSFDSICFGLGISNIFGMVSSIYYNLIFCVILAYSIRTTLKGYLFNRFRYHTISFLLTGSIILVVSLTQGLGRGLNGVCGFRMASKQSTTRFVIQIIISAICIYSMYSFKSKLPQSQFFKNQPLFMYYFLYMGIFAFTQIMSSMSYLISDIMCKLDVDNIQFKLHVLYSIGLACSIALSYFLVFVRFRHPLLVGRLKKMVGKENRKEDGGYEEGEKNDRREIPYLKEEDQNQEEDQSWLGCLLQSLKGSQILSFLQGITVAFIQRQRKYNHKPLSPLSYHKHYTFIVNQQIVQNYIERRISSRESFLLQKKLGGLVGLDYSVTSFCPEVFSSLCTRQQLRSIIRSLDIKKNIKIVKKQSYMNGGKSGELFFVTYDHRLIFKSMREDETISYLENIKDFTEHFIREKQSLIVKILGIFKFVRNDIKETPIYIMLMYNITLLPRDVNLRVYDIKGSEFNRSTMEQNRITAKNKEEKSDKLKRLTLKDKDFKQLQKKIKIDSNTARDIKRTLRKDIEFLASLGFIDYSLIIIKRQGDYNSRKQSRLSEITSSQESGVIYNFGIIDYLELWTLKRKAERVLKTLITNQQVTANSPLNYSERLCQFIETIA